MTNVSLDVSIHDQPFHSRTHVTEITLKSSKQSSMAEPTVGATFDNLHMENSDAGLCHLMLHRYQKS